MWPNSKVAAAAAAAAAALALALASAGGCTASSEDVAPDKLRIFFPTGAVVSPDGARLFVASANSDLTFDSGAISVFELAAVDQVVAPWVTGRERPGDLCDITDEDDRDERNEPCCEQSAEFSETLICDEELFLSKTADQGVRIGNFATDIALQDLLDGRLRLIVPTRGDPSIAWADWLPDSPDDPLGARLECNPEDTKFDLCDDDHRLSFVLNDSDSSAIPEEPFGAFADTAGEFAIVTHLTRGAVTLIDSPRHGEVKVTDIQDKVFDVDPTTGATGATGVAGRTPRAPGDIVYVGSRSEDKIQTFTVGRPVTEAPPFLLRGSWFFLDAVGNNTNANSSASDTRGMAFSPSGDRLYLLNRKPPTLQIMDTSIGPTGVPLNQTVGAVDICRQASTLTIVDSGDGERVYLTCFQDGQIYVVDPRGRGRVEDIITVGSGPYAVAAAPTGQRLYVTNFLEDTISVIDLMPGSATRNRVVLRIGVPRRQ